MNIQVPWAVRQKSGMQSSPYDSNFWVRRKFRDELDVAKPSSMNTGKQPQSGADHPHNP